MAIAVKWYDRELKKMVAGTVKDALEKACLMVEGDAKKIVPVVTSRLRGSITNEVEETVGRVGTNVEYARRVEMGFVGTDSLGRTYNQAPKPYLRSALEKNRSKILGLFRNLIK